MLKKAMLILLFFSSYTHAYLCRNNFTGEEFKGGNQDLVVYIDSEINTNNVNIFANVGDFIECKNEIPNQYIDYMELNANGIAPGSSVSQFAGLTGGAFINNTEFIVGNGNQKFNIFELTDGDYHPVDIDLFFLVTDPVGPYIEINPGDELMVLSLHSYSKPPESEYNYVWRIIAGNRAILATGTCEINGGQPVEVDFDNVGKSKVATDVSDSLARVRVDKTIDFDCENPGINMDINISLSATPASFSSDAFETTTGGLGVVMLHDDTVVPPFGKFPSRLEGGKGSEDLSFTLIKTPTPAANDLTEGAFSASASLIISIQ